MENKCCNICLLQKHFTFFERATYQNFIKMNRNNFWLQRVSVGIKTICIIISTFLQYLHQSMYLFI